MRLPNLEVAGANPIGSKVLLTRGFFRFLSFFFYFKLIFYRVLASFCEA